jgi:hypothetical protein
MKLWYNIVVLCLLSNAAMISTFNSDETKTSQHEERSRSTKASLCSAYNKHTGGVYEKHQLLHRYLLERKRINKWYMELFHRLLNVTVLNAVTINVLTEYIQKGGSFEV